MLSAHTSKSNLSFLICFFEGGFEGKVIAQIVYIFFVLNILFIRKSFMVFPLFIIICAVIVLYRHFSFIYHICTNIGLDV